MFIIIIIIIIFIVVAAIFIFAGIYARAKKVKQKHIDEAEKRGDMEEVKRLKDMSDDQAAQEFKDELFK
jgi:uncharacterized protein YpmB